MIPFVHDLLWDKATWTSYGVPSCWTLAVSYSLYRFYSAIFKYSRERGNIIDTDRK